MKSYLLDYDLKILVNTTRITWTWIEGCDVELVKTNYEDLFLVSSTYEISRTRTWGIRH